MNGVLDHVHRQDHRNLVLSFSDCTVVDLDGRILFDPAWGNYDLAVGSAIDSVYGGVADREKLQLYKATPATTSARSPEDAALMACYQSVAELHGKAPEAEQRQQLQAMLASYPDEWLLRAELLELADPALQQQAREELAQLGQKSQDLARLTALALDSQ